MRRAACHSAVSYHSYILKYSKTKTLVNVIQKRVSEPIYLESVRGDRESRYCSLHIFYFLLVKWNIIIEY